MKYLGILLIIVLAMSFISCTQYTLNTKTANGSFYDNIDKKTFESRSSYNIQLKENDLFVAVSIFKVPQIVKINIPVSGIDRIICLKLIEKQYLNIDRHLLFGQEYIFNENEQELCILIDLPIIYLLKGAIKFHFDILSLNSKDRYLKNLEKTIVFNWKPLQENSEKGFSYTDFSNSNIKEEETLQTIIKKEFHNCEKSRLNEKYRQEIERFINKEKNRND